LKETERPIFTQADLSFGSLGHNSLDLMFGGKIGRDRNIFRFSLYGSSTVRRNADIFNTTVESLNALNVDNYLLFDQDPSYIVSDNLQLAPNNNEALVKTVPAAHESRMLGVNMTWRGLHFTYHRMDRSDVRFLGLSPLAVSWSEASDRIQEQLEAFSFGFQRQRRRALFTVNLSALWYRINNTSTTSFIFDRLHAGLFRTRLPNLPGKAEQISALEAIDTEYSRGDRYGVANSFESRAEMRWNIRLFKRLYYDTGLLFGFYSGTPYAPYSSTPVETTPFRLRSNFQTPLFLTSGQFAEINMHHQLAWRSKNLTLTAGWGLNLGDEGDRSSFRSNGLYKIDSVWSVRACYANAFRYPSLYQEYSVYTILPQGGIFPGDEPLDLESIVGSEFGLRYHGKKGGFRGELFYFQQQANNLLREHFYAPSDQYDDAVFTGFNNTSRSDQRLQGVQLHLVWSDKTLQDLKFTYDKKTQVINSGTEFYLQYVRGSEHIGDDIETDAAFNVPRWHTQFRQWWRIARFEIMYASNRQTSVLSKSVIWREEWKRRAKLDRYPTFRTWDVMLRYNLSKNLLVYFHAINVFNRDNFGLDATGTLDDVLFPQGQGRLLRFGANYNMN
jgi:outer membrane receptor protein involved in Fe transport